jgi:hypothetical protein
MNGDTPGHEGPMNGIRDTPIEVDREIYGKS